jgi:subtilase family serine protease
MKCWTRSTQSVFIFLTAFLLPQLFAQTPARLPVAIQTEPRFALSRNTPPRIASAVDLGPADDSFMLPRITIHFQLTDAQQKELDRLVRDQQDRTSAGYHQWLTPDEFGQRFGLNDADLAAIRSWLESEGFADIDAAPGRNLMTFRGTAGQVREAFRTTIHNYRAGSETHYSNSSDPELPAAVSGVVAAIRGLHDFRPKPAFTESLQLQVMHALTPADLAVIYDAQPLFAMGITGAGAAIAVAGASDLTSSDLMAIRNFRALVGLEPQTPQVFLYGPSPGVNSDWQFEADLDLEWAGGLAPDAKLVYVNSRDTLDAMVSAVQNDVAPVISVSYSICEQFVGAAELNGLAATLEQGNAQGITIVAAAGDAGPATCDFDNTSSTVGTLGLAISVPADIPYVTAVGGTTLNEGSGTYWSATNSAVGESALSYIPELPWNETGMDGSHQAGGGGASMVFPKPDWQQGLNVPADGARDVPDLSLTAAGHDYYIVCTFDNLCSNGSLLNPVGGAGVPGIASGTGGTSASAPAFAGVVALLNQMYGRQGNINPELYRLASFSPDAFHDVTTGAITAACVAGTTDCPPSGILSLAAGPGYDLATGWGSIDVSNFIGEWGSDFELSVPPSTVRIRLGSTTTADVAVASIGHFPGTITFTCAIEPAMSGWECASTGTVQGSGNVTVTIAPFHPANIQR